MDSREYIYIYFIYLHLKNFIVKFNLNIFLKCTFIMFESLNKFFPIKHLKKTENESLLVFFYVTKAAIICFDM